MNDQADNLIWYCPDMLFDGQRLHSDYALACTGDKCIASLPIEQIPTKAESTNIAGIITPGLIDLQVNGGGGFLVNAEPTAECINAIAAAHRKLGTVAILPTVITDRPDVLEQAVGAAIEAKSNRGVIGLHLEGPHISAAKSGTHCTEFIRPLAADTLALIRSMRDADLSVMITLAPEAATSEQIALLDEMGVVVSLGHSNADAAAVKKAIAAGARSFTHLFNAMSQMHSREPGMTGAAINSRIYAGIICDGIHVADDMVGLAFRARPVADRMFLVSDAMPTVGGPRSFELYGQDISLNDDRLVNSAGSLAGAHTTMTSSVARLVNQVGLSTEVALRAAIHVPSKLMGLNLDYIVGRDTDDLVILDKQLEFRDFVGDRMSSQSRADPVTL